MTIQQQIEVIKASKIKESRILAMKLVSSALIEGNSSDIEELMEGLGTPYYYYIVLELKSLFQRGSK